MGFLKMGDLFQDDFSHAWGRSSSEGEIEDCGEAGRWEAQREMAPGAEWMWSLDYSWVGLRLWDMAWLQAACFLSGGRSRGGTMK